MLMLLLLLPVPDLPSHPLSLSRNTGRFSPLSNVFHTTSIMLHKSLVISHSSRFGCYNRTSDGTDTTCQRHPTKQRNSDDLTLFVRATIKPTMPQHKFPLENAKTKHRNKSRVGNSFGHLDRRVTILRGSTVSQSVS